MPDIIIKNFPSNIMPNDDDENYLEEEYSEEDHLELPDEECSSEDTDPWF